MQTVIRKFKNEDLPQLTAIWNEVVEDGVAFPQTEPLTEEAAAVFFADQSYTAVAKADGEIVGLYILHPNNIGRCGHICNASYAVKAAARNLRIGEALVTHCLQKGRELGFKILQFNAVVKSNFAAIHLYEKLGFVKIGTIPGGFLLKNGSYEDIVLFYHLL